MSVSRLAWLKTPAGFSALISRFASGIDADALQILICTKRAEAALSDGYVLSPTAKLSPIATFCNSKLSLFFT